MENIYSDNENNTVQVRQDRWSSYSVHNSALYSSKPAACKSKNDTSSL